MSTQFITSMYLQKQILHTFTAKGFFLTNQHVKDLQIDSNILTVEKTFHNGLVAANGQKAV